MLETIAIVLLVLWALGFGICLILYPRWIYSPLVGIGGDCDIDTGNPGQKVIATGSGG